MGVARKEMTDDIRLEYYPSNISNTTKKPPDIRWSRESHTENREEIIFFHILKISNFLVTM